MRGLIDGVYFAVRPPSSKDFYALSRQGPDRFFKLALNGIFLVLDLPSMVIESVVSKE